MRIKTLVFAIGAAFVAFAGYSVLRATVLAPAEFRAQNEPAPACPDPMFDKSAVVFDALTICGTAGVPQAKLEHAAKVGAAWLDNDGDGIIDEASVGAALADNKATVVMSANGFSTPVMGRLMAKMHSQGRFTQDLYAAETANPSRRDASQEELHHIVIGGGWAKAYPQIFDDQSNASAIHAAWKIADANRFYVYDDPTCDEPCKVMEFTYKATAAYLGSAADLADEEFTLKDRTTLTAKIPQIVEVFEAGEYAYPQTIWPDGTYAHPENITYFP